MCVIFLRWSHFVLFSVTLSELLMNSSFPCVNVLQVVSDEAKDEDPEADVSKVSSPVSPPAISLMSPKAMETAGRIIRFEEERREKAKVRHDDF